MATKGVTYRDLTAGIDQVKTNKGIRTFLCAVTLANNPNRINVFYDGVPLPVQYPATYTFSKVIK